MLSEQLAVGTAGPLTRRDRCPLFAGGVNTRRIGQTARRHSLLIGGLQTLPPESPDHRTALTQWQMTDRFVQIGINAQMQCNFYDELCHDGRVIYAATAA